MDLNGDGRLDILSGCYSSKKQPMQAPVHVLYGREDGEFDEGVALMTEEGTHLVARDMDNQAKHTTERICTQPFAYDWDGDGDLDLLIGNFKGTFMVRMNEGNAKKPLFRGEATFLKGANGRPLLVKGKHSAPFLIDWDGDGDVDLLSGSGSGGVQIALNQAEVGEKGTRTAPQFDAFTTLIEAPKKRYSGIMTRDTTMAPSTSSRIWVGDVDGDGKLDILLGDSVRFSTPKEGDTVEQARAKDGAFQQGLKSVRLAMNESKRVLADYERSTRSVRELLAEIKAQTAKDATENDDAAKSSDSKDTDQDDTDQDDDGQVDEDAASSDEGVYEAKVAENIKLLQAQVTKLQQAYSKHYQKRRDIIDTVATGHIWLYRQK